MTSQNRRSPLAIAVAVVVTLAIATGLYLAGSPGEARLRRLDERRTEDLSSAQEAIRLYWTRHNTLPAALDSVAALSDWRFRDPSTGLAYAYKATGDSTYDLCADFARESAPSQYGGPRVNIWNHGPGRQCFHLSVTTPR